MTYLVALAASYLPVALWAWFFYGQDRHRPLPGRLVVSLFLLGLGATAPAGWINGYLETWAVDPITWVAFFVAAACAEEALKLGFGWTRVGGEPAFAEVVDGMVAMTTVGLGFAAAESTRYIFDQLPSAAPGALDLPALLGTVVAVAPQRGIISGLGHVAWSGIVGYALGRHLVAGGSRRSVVAALAGAALLHAAFNSLVSGRLVPEGGDGGVQRLAGLALWVGTLALYAWLFRRALDASPYRLYQLRRRLVRSPLLGGIPADRLERATARLTASAVRPGQVVARQGDPPAGLFVVVDGRFRVTQTPGPGAAARPLPDLGPGDLFGQVALLTRRPTVADVVAETDGMLVILDPAGFAELVEDDEPLRQRLLDAARGGPGGRELGAALAAQSRSIGILPGRGPR